VGSFMVTISQSWWLSHPRKWLSYRFSPCQYFLNR